MIFKLGSWSKFNSINLQILTPKHPSWTRLGTWQNTHGTPSSDPSIPVARIHARYDWSRSNPTRQDGYRESWSIAIPRQRVAAKLSISSRIGESLVLVRGWRLHVSPASRRPMTGALHIAVTYVCPSHGKSQSERESSTPAPPPSTERTNWPDEKKYW